MRVVVYVPNGPGAERTRRAVAREVERQGHEVVSYARTPKEADAFRAAGLCDRIAGREKDLAGLEPWMMPVQPRRKIPPAVVALPLAMAAWWIAHRRPALVTGAATVAAAVVAMALLPDTPDGSPGAQRRRPPTVAPTVPAPVETPPPVEPTREPVVSGPPPTTTPPAELAPSPTLIPSPEPAADAECLLLVNLTVLLPVEVCLDQPNG